MLAATVNETSWTMFPDCDNVCIKNEPIDTDEIDPVTESVVIKCERDAINSGNKPKTVICTEGEYLAAGNVPFELTIVKEEEEPQFHNSTTTSDAKQYSAKLPVTRWECYICRHVPTNTVDLRKHIRTHHLGKYEASNSVPVSEELFHCDQCDRKYTTNSSLCRHKFIHKEKSFACDQCDRIFLHASTLRQHKRIHSGIKPYACDECDKKFSDRSAFRRHKQTHSNHRPFACDLCDQRCSRKSTLTRHLGTHTGKKCFVCNICRKKFSRNSTLNHHKMLHTGQFPFKCDKCSRKFVTKSTLTYHLQTHDKEPKPFQCDECDRSFGMKGFLNQHKRNAHRLKMTN